MLWFNKEFKETFALKEQEMAFIYDRNDRFRHIISELSFFRFSPQICKTQITDPKWAPEENPETIMTVEDDEVRELSSQLFRRERSFGLKFILIQSIPCVSQPFSTPTLTGFIFSFFFFFIAFEPEARLRFYDFFKVDAF